MPTPAVQQLQLSPIWESSYMRLGARPAIFHGEKGYLSFKSYTHFLKDANCSQMKIKVTFVYAPLTSFLCSGHNNTALNSYTKEHGFPCYCWSTTLLFSILLLPWQQKYFWKEKVEKEQWKVTPLHWAYSTTINGLLTFLRVFFLWIYFKDYAILI